MFRNEKDGTCLNVWRSTNGGGRGRGGWADIAFWPIVAWTMNFFLFFCFLGVIFYLIVIGYEDLFGDFYVSVFGCLERVDYI